MKILLAGHWSTDGCSGSAVGLGTQEALGAVLRGLRRGRGNRSLPEVVLQPFGRGSDLALALVGCPTFSVDEGGVAHEAAHARVAPPVHVIPREGSSTAATGQWVAQQANAPSNARGAVRTILLEGGHNEDPDCGLGFLEALSGRELPRDERLVDALGPAVQAAREALEGTDLLLATSTARPLLGIASVLAVRPDLGVRVDQDHTFTQALTKAFNAVGALRKPGLPILTGAQGSLSPARMPGSGSGGGVGAMVLALGGRLQPTSAVLAAHTHLHEQLGGVDLVVALEPCLHSPVLAEATLDAITEAAADHALPVVALGAQSTLSRHERAQWGLHGVQLSRESDPALVTREDLEESAARLAHTWLGF